MASFSPRSQNRGPVEARVQVQPRPLDQGPLHDHKIVAPLKLPRHGQLPHQAGALHDHKIVAPLKQRKQGLPADECGRSPRSQNRGPVEALDC